MNTFSNLGECKTFDDVVAYLDKLYLFVPAGFTNDGVVCGKGENHGAQKIFSYAADSSLNQKATLALFRERYDAVLADPNGTSYPEIRKFIKSGWTFMHFPLGSALRPKQKINKPAQTGARNAKQFQRA